MRSAQEYRMEHWMHRPAWVEIDLRTLDKNIKIVQSRIAEGSQMLAVVKGNAYGHGLRECYPVFQANGVTNFAVATLDEAIELFNDLKDRVSANVEGSKKAYYNGLRTELLEKTDALYNKLSDVVKAAK